MGPGTQLYPVDTLANWADTDLPATQPFPEISKDDLEPTKLPHARAPEQDEFPCTQWYSEETLCYDGMVGALLKSPPGSPIPDQREPAEPLPVREPGDDLPVACALGIGSCRSSEA